MTGAAIRVNRISKRYRLLADRPARSDWRLWRRLRRRDSLWALRSVSFELEHGKVLAVIGRNGSGKSTLLRVLSRITAPTEGEAWIEGRVSSLLEIGTGFQPDLSGRDNVYLNGTILGMQHREIRRKFDEIVAFAELERFIDAPVKRYSSGMVVRLAFGIAAHLDCEILFVDEALSVGDAAFQRKCMGKMSSIARDGRTVVFVSHDLTTVSCLAHHALLLDGGRVQGIGPPGEIVQQYLRTVRDRTARGECSLEPRPELPFSITRVRASNPGRPSSGVVARSGPLVVRIDGVVHARPGPGEEFLVAVDLKSVGDLLLFRTHNIESGGAGVVPSTPGPFTLDCVVPADLFPTAAYRLGIHTAISGGRYLQNIYPVLEFDVVQDELLGGVYAATHGLLTPHCDWSTRPC
jgi:lipopolysaccharide transport system ATP-binding protein